MHDIEFLSFEDICEIHGRGLAEHGEGEPGFLDEHAVRSAAAQPQAAMLNHWFHAFPAGMAAAYLCYLANQQGFRNGNKRCAVGAAIEFLARNGYSLRATPLEVYRLAVDVAGENAPGSLHDKLKQVRQWIETRLAPIH